MRVAAASVDRGTWHVMTGLPYAMRLAGFGVRGAEGPQPGPQPRRNGRVRRQGRHRVQAGRRGLRHVRRLLRRVRPRRAEHARPQAGEPLLRAGRGRPDLRVDRAAGRAQGASAAGQTRADHRRVRRRGHLRRADRQGLRRRGHRRVQHRQGRPGPVARRRPRHRLHATRTSPPASTATTSSSTPAATAGCHISAGRSHRRGTLVIVGGETGGRWLGGFDRPLAAVAAVARS